MHLTMFLPFCSLPCSINSLHLLYPLNCHFQIIYMLMTLPIIFWSLLFCHDPYAAGAILSSHSTVTFVSKLTLFRSCAIITYLLTSLLQCSKFRPHINSLSI